MVISKGKGTKKLPGMMEKKTKYIVIKIPCSVLEHEYRGTRVPEPCTRHCDDPRVFHILTILTNLFVLNHSL